MRQSYHLITLFCCFSLLCSNQQIFAQEKDTIYLRNKSIVIGELRSIKLGRVEFKGDDVGILQIKNDKVLTISAGSQHYRMETIQKLSFTGNIRPANTPGNIIINSTVGEKEIPLADISYLYNFSSSWISRIKGEFGVGYTYTKSSKIGRLNVNAKVGYRSANTETQLYGDLIKTQDSVTSYRDRENLNADFKYYFNGAWFAGTIVRYQRNRELGLLSRWQEGVGGGYNLLSTPHQRWILISGLALNQEKNYQLISKNTKEWIIQNSYQFFSFSQPNISLSLQQGLYFILSQQGRWRHDIDVKFSYEPLKDFNINLNYYYNFDKISPSTGKSLTDYGFVMGVSYQFN